MMNMTVDPLNAFEGVGEGKLLEAMGLIPYFIADCSDVVPEGVTTEEFNDQLQRIYGFSLGGNMLDNGGEISSEGVYRYPEDPPLSPLAEFKCPKQDITVFVYRYAFVAVRGKGPDILTRMD